MALLEWQKHFELGIAEVDHEHQELIRLINRVHESLRQNPTVEEISAMLGEIHSLISAHFALEEKNMQALGYPGYEEHKRDHETLLDDIRDRMDECGTELPLDRGAFSARLNAWFSDHFRTQDARLHTYLKERGAVREP
jgi:hemerythrin-like metal-binding protein